MRKEIEHGVIIPAWYGVAWYEMQRDAVICYPIPFNIIAASIRGIYHWIRHGYKPVCFNPREAYAQGFRDGKKE